jgi:hypothetical protein
MLPHVTTLTPNNVEPHCRRHATVLLLQRLYFAGITSRWRSRR